MQVATGAMGPLICKLSDLFEAEYGLGMRVRKRVRSLITELEMMHAVLLMAGKVPAEQLDQQFRIWVDKVRELSYKMVDSVDAYMVHVHDSSHGDLGPNNMKNRVKKFFKRTKKLFSNAKALHQISDAIQDAQNTAKELRQSHKLHPHRMGNAIDPRLKSVFKDIKDLVGVEDIRDELIRKLFDGDEVSKQQLKTLSIVGFGGLGKTTLARAMYDKIREQFDCAAFVSVSHNPDMKYIFKALLYGLDHIKFANINEARRDAGELLDELRAFLQDKRYLIVMDDIWDEECWELLNCAFSNNNNLGSQIITTTRIVSLSKACCSSASDLIYQMEPLSDADSKELLYAKIFGSVSTCPYEFEQVSSDILKKCGGVPLAIVAMASVLDGDLLMKTKDELHVLLKSIGRGHTNECLKNMQMILSFSYNDLPPHLKTCLLYLSTFFPGGYPIERDRLVKKWIAEEIVSVKYNIRMEKENLDAEEASKYLDELVNRNLIHPLEWNNYGEVITYQIHPMMHDILKVIAIEQNFAALLDDKDISSAHCMNVPHLSIDCQDSGNLIDLSSMDFGRGVRSLTVFGHANEFLLRRFGDIRILDVEGCRSIERADLEYICSMVLLKQLCLAKTQIAELPPEIGNLQYLEGLDVGGTQITELPREIGNLQNLRTLDARKSGVKEIPAQVVRLTRLIHLLIGDNESCEGVKLPDGIGKMKSLYQLCTIDLRKCSSSSLKELLMLPDLKEMEVVSSDEPEHARMNNAMLSFTRLRSLVVYSDFRLSTLPPLYGRLNLNFWKKLTVVRRSLKVPIVIAEYHFLSKLDIRVCKLEKDGLKILQELPRLQSLIVRLEVLPTKLIHISCEGFANLESFHVDCRMPRVIFEEGAMPKLEQLELKLYGGSASEEHMDIKHLLSLQKVTLRYSKWYATNKGVRETTEAVKTEAKEHLNEITLCIAEEEKNGICNMKTEIFQENKDATCSMMTKIEEEIEDGHADGTGYFLNRDDTQEVNLHQSSSDIASCSGTKEIEEVME